MSDALGFGEIVVVAVLAMLLFGPKRVSDLGVALGQSIRGFKKGLSGEDEIKPTATGTGGRSGPAAERWPASDTADRLAVAFVDGLASSWREVAYAPAGASRFASS